MARPQTYKEELYNSITHGIGAALSAIGLVLLVWIAIQSGDFMRIVSFTVYGISLFALYLASTLYHGAKSARTKHILRICDHASIYLLIAGTYTPFCLVTMPHFWGHLMMFIMWPVAIVGIFLKIFYVGKYDFFSTLMYLLMGWMTVIAIKPFFESLSLYGSCLVAIGGLFYTVGVIFYAIDKIPFHHVIWHFFVMGGSVCHFFAIFLYVAPWTNR